MYSFCTLKQCKIKSAVLQASERRIQTLHTYTLSLCLCVFTKPFHQAASSVDVAG